MYVKRHGKLVKITKRSIGAVSPSLLKIKRDAFERKKKTAAFRRWRRYQYEVVNGRCCTYCRHRYSGPIFVDHYIPLFRGGTSAYKNLRITCKPCNDYKSIQMPNKELIFRLSCGVACRGRH